MLAQDTAQAEIALKRLNEMVGSDHVLTSAEDLEFYAMDVYRARALPLAVVQPGTVEELCAVVKLAAESELALVPRGGGASYTDGYLPISEQSLVIDTSRLNRIVEINEEDMYVTVECGVTWAELDAGLKEKGLRTPFYGPFSGLKATVGGSTTQGSLSMGTGTYGSSADSVLGFEIALANGELLRTGAHAAANGKPFFRHYGPDLTGLFTNDAGAMGIKARITLRLIQRPAFNATCSFGFSDFDAMARGMAACARLGVADMNWGLDPGLQQGQLARTSAADARRAAIAVFKNSRNVLEGTWRLLKLAIAGKRFFGAYPYSAHFVVDGPTRAIVKSKLAVLREAGSRFGDEIAATAPTVIIAMPFIPLYPILGPKGERWVPQHGILPFSKAIEFNQKLQALYAEHANELKANKVTTASMFMSVSNHAFLHEPVFYWHDSRTPYHNRYLPADYLATLPTYEENPAARELVEKLRGKIQALFAEVGAIHLQVGKTYPYLQGRQPTATQVVSGIKRAVDPDCIMNPGALDGLNHS
jgi:glycolate oxidase